MSSQLNNKYEDAVFAFFAEPENFETMLRVNEHADSVIKQVIKDFWDALELRLTESFKQKGKDWVVKYSDDFEDRYCKLWLYNKSWLAKNDRDRPVVAVAFEDLHLGEKLFLGITTDELSKTYAPLPIKGISISFIS